MEVASIGGGRQESVAQSLRDAVRARSCAFWIVAGLTALGAALRFATLGLQSYHHDEIVTASRILRVGFGHAMSAVSFGESAPPLYYVIAWFWTQLTGTGEWGLRSISALAGVATIPIAYLIGCELRDRRAGLMTAALVAVNPMLLWYSQEARAYSLLACFCALSLLYCLRALKTGRRRDFTLWGAASALSLATHYFAVFPLLVEAAFLLRRRGREALAGLWIIAAVGIALAPLALHQMSYGHAAWISGLSLGHRLWETAATFLTGETGDIIGQPERPDLSLAPLALSLAGFALLAFRAGRDQRRAALVPAAAGAFTIAIPVLMAVLSPNKDFVIARNLLPALVPLLAVLGLALTLPSARRLGTVIAAGLLAYSLGFCIWASASQELQRPDWRAVAGHIGEPRAPRATVTWTLGEAPLRYYLSTGAIQVRASEGLGWLVHEIDFVSQGKTPPPPRPMLGPGFRETGTEAVGPLLIRRFALSGPGLAPLRLRRLDDSDLNFRTNGVLIDGIGPG